MSAKSTKPRGRMNNAFDPSRTDHLDPRTRDFVARRSRLLGPAYRLFYEHPVEFVRAKGVHLYDHAGNEYLDAYNNVPVVGHANERVATAVSEQLATLCTHTRYLQSGILTYAEDLLATFGGRIGASGHVMFTCTGSEANDLALRIAKYHTGNEGIIVTSEAYHGNSSLTASCSPALGKLSSLGAWIRQVPTPDSYRIPRQELILSFCNRLAEQIHDLERHGSGLAAFIVDPLFSSDGIFCDPQQLLGPVTDIVRRSGGLVIADEVQSGFARSGDSMWGYQRHEIEPDIVTMGKPMGNGFPIAGVAVVPEVVERFGNDVRYFNTFGGNTVAIAAAQATLDVIREEDILGNAKSVGDAVRAGAAELAERYECIGDVRGAGLYLGIELVKNRTTKEPDAVATSFVVNELRNRHVLISSTGRRANTLKIRPPLVFSELDATRLLTELDAALSSLSVRRRGE